MENHSAVAVLMLWEAGLGYPPVERALKLLSAGCPESVERLSVLTIGERDAKLLALRERIFGPTIASVATCPGCDVSLEQSFTVEDIRVSETAADPVLSVDVNGETVPFRLPNSLDLTALALFDDPDKARAHLVGRCLLTASFGEEGTASPSEPLIHRIADAMAQADPLGDIQITLTCPACSLAWQEPFDIVAFFWSELTAWASRVVEQVHRLASAYGWSEADILSMSPRRRELYLSRIGA